MCRYGRIPCIEPNSSVRGDNPSLVTGGTACEEAAIQPHRFSQRHFTLYFTTRNDASQSVSDLPVNTSGPVEYQKYFYILAE